MYRDIMREKEKERGQLREEEERVCSGEYDIQPNPHCRMRLKKNWARKEEDMKKKKKGMEERDRVRKKIWTL